jgi:hypothetical protein
MNERTSNSNETKIKCVYVDTIEVPNISKIRLTVYLSTVVSAWAIVAIFYTVAFCIRFTKTTAVLIYHLNSSRNGHGVSIDSTADKNAPVSDNDYHVLFYI